jgi:MinD superfamily P-loop ATPase
MVKIDLRRKLTKRAPSKLVIDQELCCSCGACVAVCPPDALFLEGMTLTVVQDTCTACDRCVVICPVRALALHSVEVDG